MPTAPKRIFPPHLPYYCEVLDAARRKDFSDARDSVRLPEADADGCSRVQSTRAALDTLFACNPQELH